MPVLKCYSTTVKKEWVPVKCFSFVILNLTYTYIQFKSFLYKPRWTFGGNSRGMLYTNYGLIWPNLCTLTCDLSSWLWLFVPFSGYTGGDVIWTFTKGCYMVLCTYLAFSQSWHLPNNAKWFSVLTWVLAEVGSLIICKQMALLAVCWHLYTRGVFHKNTQRNADLGSYLWLS